MRRWVIKFKHLGTTAQEASLWVLNLWQFHCVSGWKQWEMKMNGGIDESGHRELWIVTMNANRIISRQTKYKRLLKPKDPQGSLERINNEALWHNLPNNIISHGSSQINFPKVKKYFWQWCENRWVVHMLNKMFQIWTNGNESKMCSLVGKTGSSACSVMCWCQTKISHYPLAKLFLPSR